MVYKFKIGNERISYDWGIPVIDGLIEHHPKLKEIFSMGENPIKKLKKEEVLTILEEIEKNDNDLREPFKEALGKLEEILGKVKAIGLGGDITISIYRMDSSAGIL